MSSTGMTTAVISAFSKEGFSRRLSLYAYRSHCCRLSFPSPFFFLSFSLCYIGEEEDNGHTPSFFSKKGFSSSSCCVRGCYFATSTALCCFCRCRSRGEELGFNALVGQLQKALTFDAYFLGLESLQRALVSFDLTKG